MILRKSAAFFLLTLLASSPPLWAFGAPFQKPASSKQKPATADLKKKLPADKKDHTKEETEKKSKPRDPLIQDLLRQAIFCPPEFAAKAMIRIAGCSRVQDAGWKREILAEVFELAAGAPEPMKKVAILVTGATDSRPQEIARGYAFGLDELSLKCQVVREMIKLDKKKALELFRRIEPPQIQPVECEEIFLPDPAAFYETLAVVATKTFTPAEISRNELVFFLQPFLYDMTSPVQIKPVAELLMSVPSPDPQFSLLLADFCAALEKVAGDDNAFSESILFVFSGIHQLLLDSKKRGLPSDDLLSAYRSYLVRHLSNRRCATAAGSKTPRLQERLSNQVGAFNKNFLSDFAPSQREIWPITPEEIKPIEVQGFCEERMFWSTPQAKDLLMRFKSLRFANRPGGPVSERKSQAERESLDWQADYHKYLGELMAWDGASEQTAAEHFHQTVSLLRGLIEDAPNAELRLAALAELVRLLNESSLYDEGRLEWFVVVNLVIRWASVEKGQGKIFEELKESGNPVVSLYAKLEEVAPVKAPTN